MVSVPSDGILKEVQRDPDCQSSKINGTNSKSPSDPQSALVMAQSNMPETCKNVDNLTEDDSERKGTLKKVKFQSPVLPAKHGATTDIEKPIEKEKVHEVLNQTQHLVEKKMSLTRNDTNYFSVDKEIARQQQKSSIDTAGLKKVASM